jgi:hypothetical protein
MTNPEKPTKDGILYTYGDSPAAKKLCQILLVDKKHLEIKPKRNIKKFLRSYFTIMNSLESLDEEPRNAVVVIVYDRYCQVATNEFAHYNFQSLILNVISTRYKQFLQGTKK